MVSIFFRVIILYVFVIVAVRLMGKRQISEMSPSELVAMMIISDIAAIPMQTAELPIVSGLLPIYVIVVLDLLISVGNVRFRFMRRVVMGKPTIVIHKGHVKKDELSRLRLSHDDLNQILRQQGCADILQVDYGIMETNGTFSLIMNKNVQTGQQQSNPPPKTQY